MSMERIRKRYGVPAKRGARVRYTYTGDLTKLVEPRLGIITGSVGDRIRIRMEGDSFTGIYHPTWELEYLP